MLTVVSAEPLMQKQSVCFYTLWLCVGGRTGKSTID